MQSRIYSTLKNGKKYYNGLGASSFKAIFGKEKNLDLINALVSDAIESKNIPKIGKIVKIIIQELPKQTIKARGKTLDLLGITEDGGKILIEMNTSYYAGLNERNFSFVADRYSNQLAVSETYKNIKTTLQINFTCGLGKQAPPKKKYGIANLENSHELFIDNFFIIEYNTDAIEKLSNDKYKYIKMLILNKEELEKLKLELN